MCFYNELNCQLVFNNEKDCFGLSGDNLYCIQGKWNNVNTSHLFIKCSEDVFRLLLGHTFLGVTASVNHNYVAASNEREH